MKDKRFVTKTGAILYLLFACLSWYFDEMSMLQVAEVLGQVVVVFGIARKMDRSYDEAKSIDDLIRSNTK